jgi:hypothetical protein
MRRGDGSPTLQRSCVGKLANSGLIAGACLPRHPQRQQPIAPQSVSSPINDVLACDASRMVLAHVAQAHSQRGFAVLRHAGVKWPCEPPGTCPRPKGYCRPNGPAGTDISMSRLALILETPMSLQPEIREPLAKDCLQAAEGAVQSRSHSREAVLSRTTNQSSCARSIEAIESGEAFRPGLIPSTAPEPLP